MALAPSSPLDWHDPTCRRLDYAPIDDRWATCLSCGSSGAQPYSLPPLRSVTAFRLLSISPESSEEVVRCRIHVDDLNNNPIFNAISYTWADESGDDRKLAKIFISGNPCYVTKNCEAAIRRVRRIYSITYIWIDAVCIDQDNDMERGHQVKLMPQIYSRAQKVLMYIGEHNNESSKTLMDQITFSPQSYSMTEQWKALWHIIESRKYFTRLWILQEIALARQAIVLFGDSSFSWKDLTYSLSNTTEMTQNHQYSVLRLDRSISTRPNMELFLLDGGRAACAKDPRDKVYGLLGLVPGQRIGTVVADYTISAQHLYKEVAVQLAQLHGWPAVLLRAGSKYQSLSSLPSWAPDWSFQAQGPWLYSNNVPLKLPSNHSVFVSKDTIRLKLLYHAGGEDHWFVHDLQDGNIDTNIMFFVRNWIWSWLLPKKTVWYSGYQQLCLIPKPHQSRERPINVLYETKLSKDTVHMPIHQAIFNPRDLLKLNELQHMRLASHIAIIGRNYSGGFLPKSEIITTLRGEYENYLQNEPAEAWICHAENLWAKKFPPERVTNMGFSLEVFESNDLLWKLLVRHYAVRSQLVDIV